jgi:hypothetical protein
MPLFTTIFAIISSIPGLFYLRHEREVRTTETRKDPIHPKPKRRSDMPLLIKGQVAKIKNGDGKDKKSHTLQFISTDQDGGKRFDIVHLNDGGDVSQYRIHQDVELTVTPFFNKKTNQVEFSLLDASVQ